MTKTEITALKAAVAELYPQASRLQYHATTETVSGYGWQLAHPSKLAGNADQHGNGRYVLAERQGWGRGWEDNGKRPISWGPWVVFWFGPRGFANEGSWLYGRLGDVLRYVDGKAGDGSRWYRESTHRDYSAARKAAITLARRDTQNASGFCSVSANRVPDAVSDYTYQDMIDADVVRCGWSADR